MELPCLTLVVLRWKEKVSDLSGIFFCQKKVKDMVTRGEKKPFCMI
jgi:hypothetical protein